MTLLTAFHENKGAILAAMIGTFLLVFFGTGAIVLDSLHHGVIGNFIISATFGLVVLAVIYANGEHSGAHLNPAVSFAFCLASRMPVAKAALYSLFQIVAAVLASGILLLMFPQTTTMGETLPSNGWLQSFVM